MDVLGPVVGLRRAGSMTPGACGQIGRLVQTWTSVTSPTRRRGSARPPGAGRSRPCPGCPSGCRRLFFLALVAQQAGLVDGVRQRLLAVDVLAQPASPSCAARAWVWSGVLTVTASMFLARISSNILRKSVNFLAVGHFSALAAEVCRRRCRRGRRRRRGCRPGRCRCGPCRRRRCRRRGASRWRPDAGGGERRGGVEVAERGGRRGEHLPPVDPTSHERGLHCHGESAGGEVGESGE